jgi:hypothetical protein
MALQAYEQNYGRGRGYRQNFGRGQDKRQNGYRRRIQKLIRKVRMLDVFAEERLIRKLP